MQFSANLGLLWSELSLVEAVRRAKKAAFDAVEFHFPFATPTETMRDVLAETGLPVTSLNTRPGDMAAGEFGLCAVPGRDGEARDAISEALRYASAVGAGYVHIMAGRAEGAAAHDVFLANLDFAARLGEKLGVGLLIEPINQRDLPGYFLKTTGQAEQIIAELNRPNVKLMFDCYHVQIIEGDLSRRLEHVLPMLGHVQIAGVPDRGEPDRGEIDYKHVVGLLKRLGYTGRIGAEYRPQGAIEDGLSWLAELRDALNG